MSLAAACLTVWFVHFEPSYAANFSAACDASQ